MKAYNELSREELLALQSKLLKEYEAYQQKGLALDMSRGKPGADQLDLSMPILDMIDSKTTLVSASGADYRNYGILDGIEEAKELFSQLMEVPKEQVIIYGNSSLNIMFDIVSRSYTHGICGETPWCKLDKVKFLCPAPGYDRHFGITEYFNIDMITVPMNADGPDMDMIEQLVTSDDTIKGIWCVPKYSNPQGVVYSDEVIRRMAALKPAAKDFRLYWDNAYCVHDLYEEIKILNIIDECKKAGNEDLVYQFVSTSKVTFSGSGVAALSSSINNLKDIKAHMAVQTIGHDKINQLRHTKFFKDLAGLKEHMRQHADLIRPKFESVLEILERELGGLNIASWLKPRGGYFISFESMDGCAKAIIQKAKEAGVVMTAAGSTYPYQKDPKDSNIRIAPTYPAVEELQLAAELFVLCVKLVSIEKLL